MVLTTRTDPWKFLNHLFFMFDRLFSLYFWLLAVLGLYFDLGSFSVHLLFAWPRNTRTKITYRTYSFESNKKFISSDIYRPEIVDHLQEFVAAMCNVATDCGTEAMLP